VNLRAKAFQAAKAEGNGATPVYCLLPLTSLPTALVMLCLSMCRALAALLFPCLQSLPAAEVPEQPHQQQPGNAPDWWVLLHTAAVQPASFSQDIF
jgi:hypothetical protein